jgi:hypothetical protein
LSRRSFAREARENLHDDETQIFKEAGAYIAGERMLRCIRMAYSDAAHSYILLVGSLSPSRIS